MKNKCYHWKSYEEERFNGTLFKTYCCQDSDWYPEHQYGCYFLQGASQEYCPGFLSKKQMDVMVKSTGGGYY